VRWAWTSATFRRGSPRWAEGTLIVAVRLLLRDRRDRQQQQARQVVAWWNDEFKLVVLNASEIPAYEVVVFRTRFRSEHDDPNETLFVRIGRFIALAPGQRITAGRWPR
jgi:hypothetical protein